MRVPVTFGQYVPTESPIHSLDAKTKMGLVAAFTTAVFLVDGFSGLAVMALCVVAALRISRVRARIAFRGIKALTFLLGFTLAAHALRWNPATVALVRLGPLAGLVEGALVGADLVDAAGGLQLFQLAVDGGKADTRRACGDRPVEVLGGEGPSHERHDLRDRGTLCAHPGATEQRGRARTVSSCRMRVRHRYS